MRWPNRPLTATTTTSPGPDGVDERRLHARRAGRRQRQGAPVRRPEDLPEPVGRLVQDAEEHRVEVTEQRLPEGDRRLRVGVGGAGSEQGAGTQRHARARYRRAGMSRRGPASGRVRAAPSRAGSSRDERQRHSGRPDCPLDGKAAVRQDCDVERPPQARDRHRGETGRRWAAESPSRSRRGRRRRGAAPASL